MTRSDHHRFQPLFTVTLLLLGFFALAMAQNNATASRRQSSALNQLVSGNARSMTGQTVTLSNVKVQNLTQDDIVWVGNDARSSVMVMLQPSVNPIDAQGDPTPITPGDVVRVTAHVLAAPATQLLQGWGVSPADAARVQKQGVVLQAVTLEVVKRKG